MKGHDGRGSHRPFILGTGIILFVGVTFLQSWSHPALHNQAASSSGGSSTTTSLTSVGASAFPSHLYATNDDNSNPCQPRGLHLAQATNVGDDGRLSMTVSSHLDYDACRDAVPTVVYGQGLFSEGSVTGKKDLQFHYSSSQSNGMFQSPWIWHIQVDNLVAGPKRYWYKIIVHDDKGHPMASSNVYEFYTPPVRHSPTSLALIGDLGQTENSTKTMEHVMRAASRKTRYNPYPVTQVLIAGDLSYADSEPDRWTSWFAIMEPLLRIMPLHVAAGNHEIECDNVTRQLFVPYENYFRVPNRIADADILPITDEYRKTLWHGECSTPSQFQSHYDYGNAFYSYEHGLTKIIVLSSYSNTTKDSVQYNWLADELDNYDRSVHPWLIVSFHAPFYTSFLGHVNEVESVLMRDAMEDLFLEYGVNMVVNGHDHAYMRTRPMYQGQVDPKGNAPIYLTLGAGGNREQHSKGFRNETQEEWVVKRDICDYGYGHLFLANATHARFNWVRDGVSDMGVVDHVWLKNPHVEQRPR